MTVSFITTGKINLDQVFTFGLSAKIEEDSIGFFGTGLKFAVATLLRTGHSISIWDGNNEYKFKTLECEFRGKKYRHVFLNDRPLNFTTDLGKTWEVWMAFRELHSNTLDEGGRTISGTRDEFLEDHSVIIVNGHGIDQALSDKSMIFCDTPVLSKNDALEIRMGKSAFLFYKGVRVSKLDHPSLFTYNILEREELTEDRTLKYEYLARNKVGKEAAKMHNIEVLQRILTAPEGTFEHTMDFDGSNPSEEFITIVKECYRDAFLSKSARDLAKRMSLIVEPEVTLDDIQNQQMQRAVNFLQTLGFDIKRYPIKIMRLHGAMGQAKNGTIYIDPVAFRMGTKQLAGTIFEEWFHLSEGCRDETRLMQNFLIDTIMSMGEKITGQPI